MIKLKVNGAARQFDGDPEMPLLWFLRDELNLKGTKFGCGMGLCGACTVHLNGRPARACLMTISAAANATITTIEGISPDGSHPVQVAWEELDVPQCGYCQAGQIMSACALLAKNPKPADADIDSAMNGNLCRCGTYLRVRAAIHKAAELTASNTVKAAKSGAKASGAGANRLPRQGGRK
jgi:isoquinoline 1-oxidoreductase alpha subunit